MHPDILELAGRAGDLLTEAEETLATAESCSGGLIAHYVTSNAGSSRYFRGGAVAYENDVKERILGVSAATLQAHGAVSGPVARAMAEGARKAFRTGWGVGVTGVAGPGGGTPEKPVGLVHIAVAGPGGTEAGRYVFKGDRLNVKEETARMALKLLVERLQ
jgi:PncC family amidohydrolase